MDNGPRRIRRSRNLTPDEAARDRELRRKIEAEFPPLRRASRRTGESLSAALKDAIQKSNRSVYQIAKDAGVSPIVVSRFLSGERDIRMATADKLADVLGLRLAAGK